MTHAFTATVCTITEDPETWPPEKGMIILLCAKEAYLGSGAMFRDCGKYIGHQWMAAPTYCRSASGDGECCNG